MQSYINSESNLQQQKFLLSVIIMLSDGRKVEFLAHPESQINHIFSNSLNHVIKEHIYEAALNFLTLDNKTLEDMSDELHPNCAESNFIIIEAFHHLCRAMYMNEQSQEQLRQRSLLCMQPALLDNVVLFSNNTRYQNMNRAANMVGISFDEDLTFTMRIEVSGTPIPETDAESQNHDHASDSEIADERLELIKQKLAESLQEVLINESDNGITVEISKTLQ